MKTSSGPRDDEATKIADLDLGQKPAIKPNLNDVLAEEPEIQPNSLNFRINSNKDKDQPAFSRPLSYLILLLVLLFGFSLTLHYVDDLREMFIEDVKMLATAPQKKRIGKIAVPVLSQVSLGLKALRPVTTIEAAAPTTNLNVPCSTFISESINKKLKSKLTPEEFLQVTNCQLFQDASHVALQSLKKAGVNLQNNVVWERMPLLLIALEAERRVQPLNANSTLTKVSCVRWSANPDCLLRYVDESRRNYKGRWQDGFKALEPAMADKEASVKAWFYLATGFHEMKEARSSKANEHFGQAKDAIEGSSEPFLEREIYRAAIFNAVLAKDKNMLSAVKEKRPKNRIEEDSRAFLDTELLWSLSGPKAREKLSLFLQSTEAKNRFASDPRFLDVLLKETQRLNLSQEALTFSEKIFGKTPKGSELTPALHFLYVRILIGAEQSDRALKQLDEIKNLGLTSPEYYHLRGLSLLLKSQLKAIALLAAKEFQTAAGISKGEESLFAMYVALLSAANQDKASQVLKQWRSLGGQVQKSEWYLLANGIEEFNAGRSTEANGEWSKAEKLSKSKEIWQKIRDNTVKDPTFFSRDPASSLRFLLPPESPLGSLAGLSQKP